MKTSHLSVVSLFLLSLLGGSVIALGQDSESPQNRKKAEAVVAQLNTEIAAIDKSSERFGGGSSTSSSPSKSIQDKLNDEHAKAKAGGYDKDFHHAIQDNGGSRVKEEWKKNCDNRVGTKAQELNCY